MAQATKKYLKAKDQKDRDIETQFIKPETLEEEKKKILSRFARSHSGENADFNTEQIYELIKRRMMKENKENPDLGNRNFMLPSYHKKTFFKGATHL